VLPSCLAGPVAIPDSLLYYLVPSGKMQGKDNYHHSPPSSEQHLAQRVFGKEEELAGEVDNDNASATMTSGPAQALHSRSSGTLIAERLDRTTHTLAHPQDAAVDAAGQ